MEETSNEVTITASGSKFKEPIRNQDAYDEVGLHLIGHQTVSNDNMGTFQQPVIRPADDLRGSKHDLKRGSCKEKLAIPVTLFILGILFLTVFLTLSLYRQQFKVKLADGLVETEVACGTVQGFLEDGAYAFRGIPYAVPPTGNLRWKKTVPLDKMEDCWQGTFHAHVNGPLCYQQLNKDVDKLMSEDCLYLDVFTPDVTYRTPMPVVVYFASNSIVGEDSSSVRLRPTALLAKQQQMVFVTVNYRLHAFGSMALSVLNDESDEASGNYGLYDMIAALKWIQMNIDSFGGSPTTISLLGCGSSATAIFGLVVSPMSKGLFNQAWMIGGSADFVNRTLQQVQNENKSFLRKLECRDRHCLLHKEAHDILQAAASGNFNITKNNYTDLPLSTEIQYPMFVIDGNLIPDLPSKLLRQGKFNDVSMIIGAPSYQLEALSRINMMPWSEAVQHVTRSLQNFSEELTNEASERYFLNDEESNPLQIARMISEVRTLCPLFQLARRARKRFKNIVQAYTTSHLPTYRTFNGPAYLLDIAAIFNQMPILLGKTSPEDIEFSNSLQNLFFKFVRTTRFGSSHRKNEHAHVHTYLDIAGQRIVPSYKSHHPHCDLWLRNGFYPQFGRQN